MRWQQIISEAYQDETHPEVAEWLLAATQRADAGELYLHGSRTAFTSFQEPDTAHGRLIHATKLIDKWRSGKRLQAEYYGHYLYLIRIAPKKRFSPLNDPQAKAILTEALMNDRLRGGGPVWDHEAKIRYGRMDWQDAHLVVPRAVDAGYDLFEVFEDSVRSHSYGAAHAGIVEIVDRFEIPR